MWNAHVATAFGRIWQGLYSSSPSAREFMCSSMFFKDEETFIFVQPPFAGGFTGDASELKVFGEWTLLSARSTRTINAEEMLKRHYVHRSSVQQPAVSAPASSSV